MSCFEQKDIFPCIEEAIERLCRLKGQAVHADIIQELLADPEAAGIIDAAVRRCPDHTERWMAGNMVAWLSQCYTTRPASLGQFSSHYDRLLETDGTYTYRPAGQVLSATIRRAPPSSGPSKRSSEI